MIPPSRMSVAEFLAWNPGDGQSWQLVDGEPEAMAPANRSHSMIQGELARLIGKGLIERSMTCSLGVDPGVVPRVQAQSNVRVPDIAVTCARYDSEEPTLSDPVLIIEILSPSNHAETCPMFGPIPPSPACAKF